MIDVRTITAFDVETWGTEDLFALQPFRLLTGDAWLTSAALAFYDDHGVLQTEAIREPTPQMLADWLDTVAGQYVVCWNTPFDVAWLLAIDEAHPELGIRAKVFAVNWIDGMLLYRHAINAPRYREEGRMSLGLKEAVVEFFPDAAGYEEGITFNPQTEEEWERLLFYNRRDCRFALLIVGHLLEVLPEKVQRNALLEARCIPLVADTKIAGLRVHADRARALGGVLTVKRDAALVQLALTEGMLEWEKVLASPKKLAVLLYETWGLMAPHLTEKGAPSTDKEALAILGLEDPRANLIYTYRECQNRRTKFCDGALASLDYNGDGHVRPDFRIFGTYTGRGTYSSKVGRNKAERPSGIAIHQWVNDPEYRALIEVEDDEEIIEADFAGQEFRWMAVESKDAVMLSLCEPGQDPHSYMASQIRPDLSYAWIRENREEDPLAKKIRKMGKVGNLSCQYRTGPPTLRRVAAVQHGVYLSEIESISVVSTYRKSYQGVPRYWSKQIQIAKTQGWVETLAGRRVNLGNFRDWRGIDAEGQPYDWTWAHESTSINFPIQGVGADQKYLALLVARDYLPRVGGRFLMELHDGMFFKVPRQYAERAARDLKQLLSNLPYKRAWGRTLPIEFPVDVKRGPHWGALKEIK
jgi:DNA polymerase I-like protein with 3'-5' exonuclease and polymerase domains